MQFNTKNIRKVPVNRNNLFFSPESFEYETELALNYMTQDMNQTVILFEVDLERSNLNQTYFETRSGNVVYKTPVELPALYTIEEAELKSYEKDKNLAAYIKAGILTVQIMVKSLEESGAEIKVGDYIGIQVDESNLQMYTVVNDGRNNFDNEHTLYGTKPYFITVSCAPVDDSEFNGK